MGIKNLLKLLNQKEGIIKKRNHNDFKGKVIAIDISILMYQVVISIRNTGTDLTNNKGEITSHILGIFNKTIVLLDKGIIPLYVFDGKPPEIKSKILKNRKNVRAKAMEKLKNITNEKERIKYFKRCVVITRKQILECQELLELMGIPYIVAPEEADSQCAYLSCEGLVDSVLTEDMDILTFGAKNIVRNLSSHRNEPLEIDKELILEKFNLTENEFIELCVLLGCDYCYHSNSISANKILAYYTKERSLEKTLKLIKADGINTDTIENYNNAVEYFSNPTVKKVTKKDIELKKPKYNELISLLVNRYNLIKYRIVKKLDKLVINYNNSKTNENVINI